MAQAALEVCDNEQRLALPIYDETRFINSFTFSF